MEINILPGSWNIKFMNGKWQVYDNDGNTIALVEKSDHEESYACLIAASPYMLEALKGLSTLIGEEDLPDNGDLSGAAICDLVRSAVELATTKQTR